MHDTHKERETDRPTPDAGCVRKINENEKTTKR